MAHLLKRKIFAPLAERLGTMTAAFLLGTMATGTDPMIVDQFVTAIGAVVMIGFDLIVAHFERKRGN